MATPPSPRRLQHRRQGGQEGGRYRTRAGTLPEVHRVPRGQDLGDESGRDGLDVYLLAPGASWEM